MVAKLPPEIQDMEDFVEHINILCHGDSGSGKTVMGGMLPDLLILAVEVSGTISAKRYGSKAKVWKIRKWDDLVKAYTWLEESLEKGTCPFKWVMIDTITSAQVRDLRAIMDHVVAQNPKRDPDIPAIQDHYKWQLTVKRMVTDFTELPINTFWTAQSMRRETDEGEQIVLPLIEGKDFQISSWVCAQMDCTWYLKKQRKGKDVIRRLYTNNHAVYECKDRFDLSRVIDSPDIRKIVADIEASFDVADAGSKPAAKKAAPSRTRKSTTTKTRTTRAR